MSFERLVNLVNRHASEGSTETSVQGLSLFRVSGKIPPIHGNLEPSICGVVQGRKRVHLAGNHYDYDSTNYLCSTMPIPVEGEVLKASLQKPTLGVALSLNIKTVAETVVEMETQEALAPSDEIFEGLCVAPWDDNVVGALAGVLELLDDPVALKVLETPRMKELAFALLRGGAGRAIRQALGASRDVERAVSYLRSHLQEPVSIDDLAHRAGMSRAVFHRKFKAATNYTPIQYAKALRLNQAAMLIASGRQVTDAAYEVGYTSQSQFSREFRRQMGVPPREWRETLAEQAKLAG